MSKAELQNLKQLEDEMREIIIPLGYEIVALELTQSGGRTLRVLVDFLSNAELLDIKSFKRIGIEDCVIVTKALDELLENTTLIEGKYQLEVSSPGIERPIKLLRDFLRFAGQNVRIHTSRPLSAEEFQNQDYWTHHQKQKNFAGELKGMSSNKQDILLKVDEQDIHLPLAAVNKAHLEFKFEGSLQ